MKRGGKWISTEYLTLNSVAGILLWCKGKRKFRLVRLMKQIFRVATSKPWPFVVRSTAALCPKAGVTQANTLLWRLQILLITIKKKFPQPVNPNSPSFERIVF